MTKLQFGKHSVSFDKEDKVFYPAHGGEDAVTKSDVIHYYKDIAEVMVPHAGSRPLTLRRFPDGIETKGFYMQEAQDYFPDWIERVPAKRSDGSTIRHAVANGAADLAYLASLGTLEFHTWLSRIDDIRKPDWLVFDLDPPGDTVEAFDVVRQGALDIRDLLDELGLAPFVKLTGSKGLHVLAPIRPEEDFDEVRAFAHDAAELLAARKPDDYTTQQRKEKRKGRLYLDVIRNAYAQHAVAPYSLRPLPGAPVAAPLDWDEVEDPSLIPRAVTIHSVFRRLGQKDDPWKTLARHRRGLDKARVKLEAKLP
ncbi:MAG: non-homologous end-joining DNA ligase [Oceanidesulfovibrio sp.]